MSDVLLNVAQSGSPTHKLSGEQIATDGGLPVVVERVQAYPAVGALVAGSVSVGTSAAALAATAVKWAKVKARIGNDKAVWIGPSGVTVGNGWELPPGAELALSVDSLSKIFHIAAAGGATPTLDYLGAP